MVGELAATNWPDDGNSVWDSNWPTHTKSEERRNFDVRPVRPCGSF